MSIESGFTEFIVDATQSESRRLSWTTIAQQLRSVQLSLRDAALGDVAGSRLEQIATALRQAAPVDVLAWFPVGSDGKLDAPSFVRQSNFNESAALESLAEIAHQALLSRNSHRQRMQSPLPSAETVIERGEQPSVGDKTADQPAPRELTAIATPVTDTQGVFGVLAAGFAVDHEPTEWLLAMLEIAAGSVSLTRTAHVAFEREQELTAAAAVIDLASRFESAKDTDHACHILADEISRLTGIPMVAIGVHDKRRQTCQLRAVSSEPVIDADSDRTRAIEAAFDELVIHGRTASWPAASATERHSLLTLRQVADRESCEAVAGFPIRDGAGKAVAVCVLAGEATDVRQPETKRFTEACLHRLGDSFSLVSHARRSALETFRDSIRSKLGSRRRLLSTIALTTLALAILPVPWSVECRTELQPVTRRFVAAPFDGTLQDSFVEPGDLVAEGQVLAQLDGREIDWELAGLDAEYGRAARERDSHLAGQDIGAAQLSKFDMDRIDQRRQLLRHRMSHLEIASPGDGLVISGDLRKSEGAPLQIGQTLFEIAPLDRMLVEVAIPERDVAHVKVGQFVDIKLDAWPNRTWTGTLIRIHPRTETRDEETVFIGEIELTNPEDLLRPGMQGSSQIETGWSMLGWVVLHRPWESLLLWMGW